MILFIFEEEKLMISGSSSIFELDVESVEAFLTEFNNNSLSSINSWTLLNFR